MITPKVYGGYSCIPPSHNLYMHSATGRPQLVEHSYVIRVLQLQALTKRINDKEAGSLISRQRLLRLLCRAVSERPDHEAHDLQPGFDMTVQELVF